MGLVSGVVHRLGPVLHLRHKGDQVIRQSRPYMAALHYITLQYFTLLYIIYITLYSTNTTTRIYKMYTIRRHSVLFNQMVTLNDLNVISVLPNYSTEQYSSILLLREG